QSRPSSSSAVPSLDPSSTITSSASAGRSAASTSPIACSIVASSLYTGMSTESRGGAITAWHRSRPACATASGQRAPDDQHHAGDARDRRRGEAYTGVAPGRAHDLLLRAGGDDVAPLRRLRERQPAGRVAHLAVDPQAGAGAGDRGEDDE